MAFARDVVKQSFIVTPAEAGVRVLRRFWMSVRAGWVVFEVLFS